MKSMSSQFIHFVERFHKFWMFIGDMLLDERCSFEEFLTCFAPEFTLVFLFQIWFHGFGQFPENRDIQ
jgi:hypothetical protein